MLSRSVGIEFELHGIEPRFAPVYRLDGEYFYPKKEPTIYGSEYAIGPVYKLDWVPDFVKFAKETGFKSGYQCGMHVHVGLTQDEYNIFPTVLRRVIGPKPSNERKSAGTFSELIQKRASFKTIEFRGPNMVLNSRYICKTVNDCIRLTDMVLTNPEQFGDY